MTTPDLERRLAVALHRHAEDAMNNTRTEHELHRLLTDTPIESGRRRRNRVALALVAAAAVVAAVVFGVTLVRDRDTAAPAVHQDPVDVATDFVNAYADYDVDAAAALLDEHAVTLGLVLDNNRTGDWLDQARWLQAVATRYDLGDCVRIGESTFGTEVRCPFAVHSFYSEERGKGPFDNNVFELEVKDGKIVSAAQTWDWAANGFSDDAWEPFVGWVYRNHRADVETMYASYPDMSVLRLSDESIELWREYMQEFLEART